ncbi:ras guanine nucleotide exchange factor F isoform X3 [Hypanus sabinus]|uniref:ras guanine nucleotide exchange factor F isoform X3 n=1 Tax=Hypanus sabinus TaxID=79690 RepID=UPI0028C4F0DD|nr:ras guanine nucleotide exchange factor F isoform X3 [Hypanus sabinus]
MTPRLLGPRHSQRPSPVVTRSIPNEPCPPSHQLSPASSPLPCREPGGSVFRCRLEVPLPKYLVVFGLGSWDTYTEDTSFSVEVSVGPELKPHRIGVLSSAVRCLVWQGDWTSELTDVAGAQGKRSGWPALCVVLGGQMSRTHFLSSTPVCRAQSHQVLDTVLADLMGDVSLLSPGFLPIAGAATAKQGKSLDLVIPKTNGKAWRPAGPFRTPTRAVGSSNSSIRHQEEEEEEETGSESDVKRLQTCPSPRWDHALCLSDPNTAILVGGEGPQNRCSKDGLWRLEIDNGDIFWFPLETTSTLTIPLPQSVCGHSATYDPDANRIYIFGGKNDAKCFNDVYILDTLTWKWSFMVGKGKVPSLAYHSAVVFQQELFIFGGLLFRPPRGGQVYSNTLYIFNPEHEIWYQPIVVGERPLPRCGHTATLLRDKLIIFGGNRSSVFLNDLHILDLGFMEYVSVQIPGPPAPRCRHAAVPVNKNKVLISGGYNLTGALRDVFIFNLDTYNWSSLNHHPLCSVPRAGHSLLYLSSSQGSTGTCLKLLVFGGSNNAGQFYNDTLQVTVELGEDCSEKPHT